MSGERIRMNRNCLAGAFTIGGAITFVAIVVGLQIAQPGYDLIHQHMSELASGRAGGMMVVAFAGFGASIYSAQIGLENLTAPKIIRGLLYCAAISMVGAGTFKLNEAAVIHVSLIASAFIFLVISMYLLPLYVARFSSRSSRIVSWALAAGTAVSVAFGGRIPEGIAQRIAAVCIIVWLVWIGLRTICAGEITPNHGADTDAA